MIFGDIARALGQIGDRSFRGVIFKGVGLTILLLFALYALVGWVAAWLAPDSLTLPMVGTITWVDSLFSGASVLLMVVLSVFLMIPVASAFTSMFLDEVADAVEDRHYPDLPQIQHVPWGDALRDSVGFLGVLILANLLALIVYAIMALTVILAPFAPLVFYALNGFLLGREYFQLSAMRRLGRAGAKSAFRRKFLQIWLAGILMAIPLTVPVLNLIVPVIGAATFTHLFHRVDASR